MANFVRADTLEQFFLSTSAMVLAKLLQVHGVGSKRCSIVSASISTFSLFRVVETECWRCVGADKSSAQNPLRQ